VRPLGVTDLPATADKPNAVPFLCRTLDVIPASPHHLPMPIARLFTLSLALLAVFALRAEGPQPVSDSDKAFFVDLRKAVVNSDRAWIADHVALPLRVHLDGGTRLITTREEFLQDFDQIMKIRIVAAVHKQSSETLVKTNRGIMIGDGEIWFAPDSGEGDAAATAPPVEVRYRIIEIGS
jgi:hypothetical protein